MSFENQRESLIGMVKGIAKMMGDNTEVTLHDLKKQEIVHIENGHITNREVGMSMDMRVYESIRMMSDNDGHWIGYKSETEDGLELRASHFIIKDSEGVEVALICVNQDVSELRVAKNVIEKLLGTNNMSPVVDTDSNMNFLQKVAINTILSEIERLKPYRLDTKQAKLMLIERLDLAGVFSLRDSVVFICDFLSISQATFYNYHKEIKNRKEE